MDAQQAADLLGWEWVPPGWDFVEVLRRGELAGFFMVKGNEIHAWRFPYLQGRWLTRQDLERLTAPLFKRYGYIVTSVSSHNQAGHKFVTRLGFTKTSEEHGICHYRAERLHHARL